MLKIAVLLSGRGSNFVALQQAIENGTLQGCRIVCAGSNRPDAAGLIRAGEAGIPAFAIDHREFGSRQEHEAAMRSRLSEYDPGLLILAGYMRKLSADFVGRYRNRILNIHPSLLPAFPGVDAQRQALEYGVKVSGCTVHFVDETLDCGPILLQRTVLLRDTDSEETLSSRILEQEHIAYVEAVRRVIAGVVIEGRIVRERP